MQSFEFQPPGISISPSAGLLFSTDFNRATDWNQSSPDLPMPNMGRAGGWTCGGTLDSIIQAASRTPGGRGFRHWRCAGTNSNGGGISISPTPPASPEFWLRYWIRYQPGFGWLNGNPHYTKDFYIYTTVGVGVQGAVIIGFQGGGYGAHITTLSQNFSGGSWASTMADGQWHGVEVHVSSNKVEVWLDDMQIVNASPNVGMSSWAYFVVGSNQNQVVGGPYWTDFDDIAISTSGRIGL